MRTYAALQQALYTHASLTHASLAGFLPRASPIFFIFLLSEVLSVTSTIPLLQDPTCFSHAYVSIRQHTSAYVSACDPTCFSHARKTRRFRGPHTSAYVSIRQHTSAHATPPAAGRREKLDALENRRRPGRFHTSVAPPPAYHNACNTCRNKALKQY